MAHGIFFFVRHLRKRTIVPFRNKKNVVREFRTICSSSFACNRTVHVSLECPFASIRSDKGNTTHKHCIALSFRYVFQHLERVTNEPFVACIRSCPTRRVHARSSVERIDANSGIIGNGPFTGARSNEARFFERIFFKGFPILDHIFGHSGFICTAHINLQICEQATHLFYFSRIVRCKDEFHNDSSITFTSAPSDCNFPSRFSYPRSRCSTPVRVEVPSAISAATTSARPARMSGTTSSRPVSLRGPLITAL